MMDVDAPELLQQYMLLQRSHVSTLQVADQRFKMPELLSPTLTPAMLQQMPQLQPGTHA